MSTDLRPEALAGLLRGAATLYEKDKDYVSADKARAAAEALGKVEPCRWEVLYTTFPDEHIEVFATKKGADTHAFYVTPVGACRVRALYALPGPVEVEDGDV